MKERDLQESTRRLLQALRGASEILQFFHTYDMRRSQPGYPDWTVIIRLEPGRTPKLRRDANKEAIIADSVGEVPLAVWIELKTPKGELTPHQERWAADLGDRFFVARSLDEFADVLRAFGVSVRLGP